MEKRITIEGGPFDGRTISRAETVRAHETGLDVLELPYFEADDIETHQYRIEDEGNRLVYVKESVSEWTDLVILDDSEYDEDDEV